MTYRSTKIRSKVTKGVFRTPAGIKTEHFVKIANIIAENSILAVTHLPLITVQLRCFGATKFSTSEFLLIKKRLCVLVRPITD